MSSVAVRPNTLADALIPGTGVARDVLLTVGGAALTAVGAQVTIPWHPVPFTLQTLFVMLCGLALGARRGSMSQLMYLAAGASGLPVFAGGAGGAHVFAGPTAGYLLTYPIVAGLLGFLADKGWTKHLLGTAVAMLIGDSVTLLFGATWLAVALHISWPIAAQHGILPFIGVEIVKAIVVVLTLPAAWRFVGTSAQK